MRKTLLQWCGAVVSLPARLRWGAVQHEQRVFFPPWVCYRPGHPHASEAWRTVAGVSWGLRGVKGNSLRLRAVRTGNGDVLLGISQYTHGQHYSKPLCTVPAGSDVRVSLQEHRGGQVCLSVYRGGQFRGCYWYEAPANRSLVNVLVQPG
jgi:hypothetical protein